MIGPVLFTDVSPPSSERPGSELPGAPFLLAALLVAMGFALAWRVRR